MEEWAHERLGKWWISAFRAGREAADEGVRMLGSRLNRAANACQKSAAWLLFLHDFGKLDRG